MDSSLAFPASAALFVLALGMLGSVLYRVQGWAKGRSEASSLRAGGMFAGAAI